MLSRIQIAKIVSELLLIMTTLNHHVLFLDMSVTILLIVVFVYFVKKKYGILMYMLVEMSIYQ